jgi:hypothetical protein
MTDETKQNPEGEPLQFDTAEPVEGTRAAATSLTCTACSTDITTSYYEVSGAIVCLSCRAKLHEQFTGGSRWTRFGKAAGFGLIAAAVSAALYYGVGAITGYGIGLLVLLIGFLVGRAVNLGSGQRGGRAYQILAAGLTYFAIASTYVPEIVKSAREQAAVTAADTSKKALVDTAGLERVSASAGPQIQLQGTTTAPAFTTSATRPITRDRTVGEHVFRVIVAFALVAALPIIAGFDSILFLVVTGLALFEAWRQNRRFDLVITGPYGIGQSRDGQPPAAAAGG